MNVLIFGATGMVGQGVLLECLRDADVESVVSLGRTATGVRDAKLREIVHRDLLHYEGMEESLAGFDACFFCLGVASTGMKEDDYTRVTYGFALAAAEALSHVSPGMTFIYVSGSGTDSTERGRSMWARVKGRTENALLRLPLSTYAFRPGFIEPMDGIQSKAPMYRKFYRAVGPLLPILHRAFPNRIMSTREIGQAMIAVARHGYEKRILETKDIRRVVGPRAAR
ncbi:MAG: SDR family oxidoreductase [Terracidiphilus sp.]